MQWHQSHTWFPGFAWKQCMCPKCAGHLGWMFEPFETANASQHFPTDGRGFYLLIVHNVLSESCKYTATIFIGVGVCACVRCLLMVAICLANG